MLSKMDDYPIHQTSELIFLACVLYGQGCGRGLWNSYPLDVQSQITGTL